MAVRAVPRRFAHPRGRMRHALRALATGGRGTYAGVRRHARCAIRSLQRSRQARRLSSARSPSSSALERQGAGDSRRSSSGRLLRLGVSQQGASAGAARVWCEHAEMRVRCRAGCGKAGSKEGSCMLHSSCPTSRARARARAYATLVSPAAETVSLSQPTRLRGSPPPLPSRTNWTRLVPRPVLNGHVSSPPDYVTSLQPPYLQSKPRLENRNPALHHPPGARGTPAPPPRHHRHGSLHGRLLPHGAGVAAQALLNLFDRHYLHTKIGRAASPRERRGARGLPQAAPSTFAARQHFRGGARAHVRLDVDGARAMRLVH
jgi:hypothetical protein